MTDYAELKLMAECAAGFTDMSLAPDVVLGLIAELDRLRGIQPAFPPRPPEGEGLFRYGIRWNGPQQPLAVLMDDGYWTPWHLADQLKAENEALRQDAERFRHLMFNHVDWARNGKDDDAVMLEFGPYPSHKLRESIDAAMSKESGHG